MDKMGQQQQQQQEMMGDFVGPQHFAISQPQQQQQFGEVINLPCTSAVSGSGGGSIFQTPSGSTICQLGTAVPPQPMDNNSACLCSPASSASGSQPRLVHLSSGSCANDSGISSGAGSYGGGSVVAQPLMAYANFSPDIRGTEQLEELAPEARNRSNTWHGFGGGGNSQTSPPIHDRIPEEESMYGDDDVMPMDGFVGGVDTASDDCCCVAATTMMTDNANDGASAGAEQHYQLLMLQQQQQHSNNNNSAADIVMLTRAGGGGGTLQTTAQHHYQQQQQMLGNAGSATGVTVGGAIRRHRRPSSSSSSATNGGGAAGAVGITTTTAAAATTTTTMMMMPSSSLLMGGGNAGQPQQQQQYCAVGDGGEPMLAESPGSGVDVELQWSEMSPLRPDSAIGDSCSRSDSPPSAAKKATTRRNAWGNLSYADLITQAIQNSPEQRLTLSQVYEWMVQNVPYFRDKGDSNSSAGWKNSIRHNLSLHSRFMRIQNEGAGKSSWWVINPDAKPGRNPRRRANTMEAATKAVIDKKRRGARKRVEAYVQQKGNNGGCSSSMASILGAQSAAMFPSGSDEPNDPQQHMAVGGPPAGPNFDTFRPRAESTLSVVGGPASCSRLSPTNEASAIDFPLWMDMDRPLPRPQQPQQQNACAAGGGGGDGADTADGTPAMPSCSAAAATGGVSTTTTGGGAQSAAMNPQVSELLDRTDQMRLEANVAEQNRLLLNNNTNNNVGLLKMEMGCCPVVSTASSCASSSATFSPSSSLPMMPKSEIGANNNSNNDPSAFAHIVKHEHQQQPSSSSPLSAAVGAQQTLPPSYQELSAVRRPAQMRTNPLLRQIGGGAGGGTPSPPQMKMGGANINNTSAMMAAVPSCSSSSPNMFSTSSTAIVQSACSASSPFAGGGGGGPFASMPSGGVWLPPGASLAPLGCGGGGQQQQMVPPQQHQQQLLMMSSSTAGMSPLNQQLISNGTMVGGIGTPLQPAPHQFGAGIGISAGGGPTMAVGTALPSDLENVNVMSLDPSLFSDFAIAELGNGLAGGGQFDFSLGGAGGGREGGGQGME